MHDYKPHPRIRPETRILAAIYTLDAVTNIEAGIAWLYLRQQHNGTDPLDPRNSWMSAERTAWRILDNPASRDYIDALKPQAAAALAHVRAFLATSAPAK